MSGFLWEKAMYEGKVKVSISDENNPLAWVLDGLVGTDLPCDAVLLFPGTSEERIVEALERAKGTDGRLLPLLSVGTTREQRAAHGLVTGSSIRQIIHNRGLLDLSGLVIRARYEGDTVGQQIKHALEMLGQLEGMPPPRKVGGAWLDEPPLSAKTLALVAPSSDAKAVLWAWSQHVQMGVDRGRVKPSALGIRLRPVSPPPSDSPTFSPPRSGRDTLLMFVSAGTRPVRPLMDDHLVFGLDDVGASRSVGFDR